MVDLPAEDVAPAGIFALLTHGAGGDCRGAGLSAFAQALAAQGIGVVRFDLPFRRAGRRAPLAARSVPGYRAAFDRARSVFDADARWIIGGSSYGGRVASLAVADGLDADGLLLVAYPLHRPGDPGAPRVEHWPNIGVPVMFIQGSRDAFANLDLLKDCLPGLGVRAHLEVVEGADHSLKRPRKASNAPKQASDQDFWDGLAHRTAEWAFSAIADPRLEKDS